MDTLLVVTLDIPFGELIRQNLEETGRFSVRVTGEKKNAIEYAKDTYCSLAFLDADLGEESLFEISILLRKVRPDLRFVIVSKHGERLETLEELRPADYLSKPFVAADLVEMMDRLFPIPRSAGGSLLSDESEADQPWLADVSRAAQHLTRLTLESSAQAALITRDDQLWAYAGQLPQSATRELTETVLRYWNRQEQNDLVRFIRLASTDAEHMLYATRLAPAMVLALIFDAETPFSTIRSQANQLVHSLAGSERSVSQQRGEEEPPPANIADILSDIPAPNPQLDSRPLAANRSHFSRESSPAIPLERPADQALTSVSDLEKTVESSVITRKSRVRKDELESDDLGETRPTSSIEGGRRIVLEPVSASVYNLDYACLLVPRFTHHYLTGDLSDHLTEWTPQICIAFGWRLEYISVRPEYLLWIVNVPPATSPGYLMRILRQNTSEKIFTEFSRFKKENPSGDFWAPGYLIMGGSQPPPAYLIKDFITQTRQRQGFSQPRR